MRWDWPHIGYQVLVQVKLSLQAADLTVPLMLKEDSPPQWMLCMERDGHLSMDAYCVRETLLCTTAKSKALVIPPPSVSRVKQELRSPQQSPPALLSAARAL